MSTRPKGKNTVPLSSFSIPLCTRSENMSIIGIDTISKPNTTLQVYNKQSRERLIMVYYIKHFYCTGVSESVEKQWQFQQLSSHDLTWRSSDYWNIAETLGKYPCNTSLICVFIAKLWKIQFVFLLREKLTRKWSTFDLSISLWKFVVHSPGDCTFWIHSMAIFFVITN